MCDHPRLRHLTSHERDVLAEFLSRLEERCGDRIAHVWLFGSRVRGDFDEERFLHQRGLLTENGER
jgi:predicted nucleotidyltransferase